MPNTYLVLGCFNNKVVITVYQLKSSLELNSVKFSLD